MSWHVVGYRRCGSLLRSVSCAGTVLCSWACSCMRLLFWHGKYGGSCSFPVCESAQRCLVRVFGLSWLYIWARSVAPRMLIAWQAGTEACIKVA